MSTPVSLHQIALDIMPVGGRPCRRFQETISEYGMDGRPRFEWEAMRHRMILHGDPAIAMVCAPCPLNLMQAPEGCKGTIDDLDIFLRAVARLAPESPWTTLPMDPEPLSAEVTRQLYHDLAHLETVFSSSPWKVAQWFRHGAPVLEEFADGATRPRFYSWNGESPPHLVSRNEGYQIFLCPHGLIVKALHEDPVPHVFAKLWRESSGVFGQTPQGETIGFQMNMARYPEWDHDQPRAEGELRVTELAASEVFRDALDMLAVFTGVAGEAETGIVLYPL